MIHIKSNARDRPGFIGNVRLGAAPIGNLYRRVTDRQAVEILSAASAAGIRSIDTAPYYGHGLSETRIGQFLSGHPGSMEISTKVGRRLIACGPSAIPDHGFVGTPALAPVFDYSSSGIIHSFEESLERLGVATVDTLLLHDVGRETHGDRHEAILQQAIAEALPAMAALRDAGRVRRIGIGVNEIAVVEELLPLGLLDVVLLAGRYSLLDISAAPLFDRCIDMGVQVLAAGVYNSGLLAGGSNYQYQPASAALVNRRDEMEAICARYDVALAAAALAFPLKHPAVEQIVVGLQSVEEVAATVKLIASEIPDDLWRDLGLGAFLRC